MGMQLYSLLKQGTAQLQKIGHPVALTRVESKQKNTSHFNLPGKFELSSADDTSLQLLKDDMSFGKQAQQLITDPEVYRLFDAVADKVDAIVELLAEKRRLAVAILKDYTDGLMETMEGQLKQLPPAEEEEEEDEEDEEETDLSSSSNNSDSYQDCIEWTLEESKNSAGDH